MKYEVIIPCLLSVPASLIEIVDADDNIPTGYRIECFKSDNSR